MPYNKLNISGATSDVLSWVTHEMSHEEHDMLRNVSRLPCLYKHVALMPDAHVGIGATVGSVIPTKGAIIPQPMSTPTVAGITASFVAMTEPTIEPLPKWASGISATCL